MSKWLLAVDRAIARNKRNITYGSKSIGTYDPNTGTNSNSTTDTNIVAATSLTKRTQTDGSNLVMLERVTYYISASSAVTPKVNDVITDGTDKHTVDKVEKHYAGGELVLYICYCV